MSTATTALDQSAVAEHPELAVEERGTTTIADRVVERIAAQAVAEVDNATGAARSLLGVTLGSTTAETAARVSARVDGPTATVEVSMTVIYPASVRDVTRQVRRHLTERVRELTGVDVAQVDIDVTGMSIERPNTPRVR